MKTENDFNWLVGCMNDGYERIHGSWGFGHCDDEGEVLLKAALAFDLAISNTWFKTRDYDYELRWKSCWAGCDTRRYGRFKMNKDISGWLCFFNKLLQEEVIPNEWCNSKLVPIYKNKGVVVVSHQLQPQRSHWDHWKRNKQSPGVGCKKRLHSISIR